MKNIPDILLSMFTYGSFSLPFVNFDNDLSAFSVLSCFRASYSVTEFKNRVMRVLMVSSLSVKYWSVVSLNITP